MDFGSPVECGFKGVRDISRRDEEGKMRSLNALGVAGDEFSTILQRKSEEIDRNGADNALTSKNSGSRKSFGIDKQGIEWGERSKHMPRRSCAVERECGESDGIDGAKVHRIENADGGRNFTMEGSESEEDGIAKGEVPRAPRRKASGFVRDLSERDEVAESLVRRGFASKTTAEGEIFVELSERAGTKVSRNDSTPEKDGGDREEAHTDFSGKSFPPSKPDGQTKGVSGKSAPDKCSERAREEKESFKHSPSCKLGSSRERGGGSPKSSPRKGYALENEARGSVKLFPSRGFELDRDPIDRRETGKPPTSKIKRFYEEGERPSPGKGYEYSLDVEMRTWHPNRSQSHGVVEKGDCESGFDGKGVTMSSQEDFKKGGVADKELKEMNGESSEKTREGLTVSSEDSDGSFTERDFKQDRIKETQMQDSSSSLGERIEEGEFDAEEKALKDSEIKEELESDVKESVVGIDNKKEEEDVRHNDNQVNLEAQGARDRAADKSMLSDTMNEETAKLHLERKYSTAERGSGPVVGGRDKQPHYIHREVRVDHAVVMREEEEETMLASDRKTSEGTIKDIGMAEGCKGLTLDLFGESPPLVQSKEGRDVQLNLLQRKTGQNVPEERNTVDHIGKELTLSLSMAEETVAECWKGKDSYRADIVNTSWRKDDLRRVNSLRARLGKQGRGNESEELIELPSGRHEQKRPKREPLELSLGLPEISLEPASSNPLQVPATPEPDRSNASLAQTCTNCSGFTTSVSFSQSQSFVHNPSCSLNHNSFEDQEYSCGSQQISQANEQISHGSWQAHLGNDQICIRNKRVLGFSQDRWKSFPEIPPHQRFLYNTSVQNHHQGFSSLTRSNRDPSLIEKRFEMKESRHEKRSRLPKEVQHRLHQNVSSSPAQSIGSRETRSQYKQPERERLDPDGEWCALSAQRAHIGRDEYARGSRSLMNEKIGLLEIATEPVAIMAQKLQELPESFLQALKDLVKEMLGSIEKRQEFMSLQKFINSRTDLTHETLLRAHRTQLELLVAMKTGMQAFVHPECHSLTYKALVEIFLQTRCPNFSCQSPLPGEECECRICSQKGGFCNVCMCIVCSKFDFDANTCRWVGCDYCMHWCHTDCGLRMSYIAPGPSVQGAVGASEMQFRCIACDHMSELFGFVKEVFTTCAGVWNAETLAKELDCVRRIFHGSDDMRGKQLCWKAEQMLQRLENKVDVVEVRRSMLRFFVDGDAELDGAFGTIVKQPLPSKCQESCDQVADAVQAMLKMSSSAGKKLTDLNRPQAALEARNLELEEKRTEITELQCDRARKKSEIEELESFARIKEAEAKMLQLRADESRQEADGLQHIAVAKCDKIEKEYAFKYSKLRLHEAEEKWRKQLEELQALERGYHDYLSMKTRMEADVKGLLKKMEATKWQLAPIVFRKQ